MEDQNRQKRLTVFLLLLMLVLLGNAYLMSVFNPPQPPEKGQVAKQAEVEPPAVKADDEEIQPPIAVGGDPVAPAVPAEKLKFPARWVTLGSADPTSPFRMLVTLTARGAAVERVELNGPRYRDLEIRNGYLGHVVPLNVNDGCVVQVVGPGTPAAIAGLRPGDKIKAFEDVPVNTAVQLLGALKKTKPRERVRLLIERDERELVLEVVLGRRPLEIIRPELKTTPLDVITAHPAHDPFSFLLGLARLDDQEIKPGQLDLPGLELRDANWELTRAEPDLAEFRMPLAGSGLTLVKRYHLAKVPPEQLENEDFPAYHLVLDIEIENAGTAARRVAYVLDGPNGLPTEGWWYASKISRNWGGSVGLRDVAVQFEGARPALITRSEIVDQEVPLRWVDEPLNYIAVDAQYFAAAMLPRKKQPNDVWLSEVKPVQIGFLPKDNALAMLANVSFRLTSQPAVIQPGATVSHSYRVFLGPKKPDLLAEYSEGGANLGALVYYGWFGWVARPLLRILHGFYSIVGNYGIAIIMLTIVVRGCMFPLSRKQALAAQKMQELQPEIKRIAEKYKDNLEARTKAQQELFRKHNYNPLGGCLLMFIQLPIFIGLYRSLMVDVELRQAPLISDAFRWASNLSAPDMLWYWEPFLPAFLASPTGWLGPYLNILPIITVALFLWQTFMFMPPPTDEQARMQQAVMKWMTILMGFLFFKVAAGLCLYFIASSLWGIGERKLLPRSLPPKPGGAEPGAERAVRPAPQTPAPSGDGSTKPARQRKKQRGKR